MATGIKISPIFEAKTINEIVNLASQGDLNSVLKLLQEHYLSDGAIRKIRSIINDISDDSQKRESLMAALNGRTIQIDGTQYPIAGFGTSPLRDEICTQAVKKAAAMGYRIIDTATYYRNFPAIAKALEGHREEFYIISKVWHNMQTPEDLRKDIASTLEQLQTDHLDAYLLHWPNSKISIETTLIAMEELRRDKKIRHIGLSNVTVNHLRKALSVGVPITWVQIEMNPNFYDPELLSFCKEHFIIVQAWSPLGSGSICEDAMLAKIGAKYGKTPAQVTIRWVIQHGCVPLPKSKNEEHIKLNMQVDDFQLSSEEMEEINQRARHGQRTRYAKEFLGFTDEFDFSYEECWPTVLNSSPQ